MGNDALLVVHLGAMAGFLVVPLVSFALLRMAAGRGDDTVESTRALVDRLRPVTYWCLALLWATGIWLAFDLNDDLPRWYNSEMVAELGGWFVVKVVAVVLLTAAVFYGHRLLVPARGGNASAQAQSRLLAAGSVVAAVVALSSSVFNFH